MDTKNTIDQHIADLEQQIIVHRTEVLALQDQIDTLKKNKDSNPFRPDLAKDDESRIAAIHNLKIACRSLFKQYSSDIIQLTNAVTDNPVLKHQSLWVPGRFKVKLIATKEGTIISFKYIK